MKSVSEKFGCSVDTVSNIIRTNNISKNNIPIDYDKSCLNKPMQINQFNLDGTYLRTFESVSDAAR